MWRESPGARGLVENCISKSVDNRVCAVDGG